MMTIPISPIQRARLAQALTAARPDWETPGVDNALKDAIDRYDETIHDLAIAAFRAARNAANRTPAIIAMNGPHRSQQPASDRPTAIPPCPTHGGTTRRPDGTHGCCWAENAANDDDQAPRFRRNADTTARGAVACRAAMDTHRDPEEHL